MNKARAVIFDCDGVLVDSEILANQAEVEVKTQLGFPITLEEQIKKFAGCGVTHPLMQEEIARLPEDYIELVDKRCFELYESRLKPIFGVVETLDSINVPVCVASSSEPFSLEKKLKITELDKYFKNATFHGRHVKRVKPEPDLFLYALEKMNWRANETLVVEDSVYGVKAGKAAGMTVIGFVGGGHIYPGHTDLLFEAGADFVISDIRNLLRLLL